MKTFGIYLAYGPRTDLRSEGLGRHLAEFLRASTDFTDARFVIAAPGWMRSPLLDLFKNFDLDADAFEIISPKRPSLIGVLYTSVIAVSERRKKIRKKLDGKGRLKKAATALKKLARRSFINVVRSRNPLVFVAVALFAIAAAPIAAILGLCVVVPIGALSLLRKVHPMRKIIRLKKTLDRNGFLTQLSHNGYRLMCDLEASSVADAASERRDVVAWYSPAAFWPEFNQITAPRVMCVPDAVPIHFSVAFATDEPSPDRRLQDFRRLESAIEGGDRFVTYSQDVRDRTLVRHFHIDPSRVTVVRHGANRLDDIIKVSGFADNEEATDVLSARHLWTALCKSMNNPNAAWYASKDTGFLFYASQIRPNKNVMTLLKAYQHLRHDRAFPYKLILTGNLEHSVDVSNFMDDMHLHDDVIFVRGLSERELASCYRLAALSVNPSLSEGGMPFTFSESVSVGTPVIMADIPVTREILGSHEVASKTLFDAMDYRAVARAIDNAMETREELLKLQEDFYSQHIVGRSYRDVVGETIAVLEQAAEFEEDKR